MPRLIPGQVPTIRLAAANGVSKPDAARVLRHIADAWDAESGEGR
ncbi:hypothetical protein [Streptomyces sp. NBRC 109706]|nr:hypothetical protein [Streptomyces sp. NBRC 109706]